MSTVPDPLYPAPTPIILPATSIILKPTYPAPTPVILPATSTVPDPMHPAPSTLTAATNHNFVTHSDFLAGIGELRQFLQDEIVAAVRSIASTLPMSQRAPTPRPPTPNNPTTDYFATQPAPPPATHNPALPACIAPVLIEGFSVVKGPTTSTSNRQFVKAVPNFLTFSRLWVIYLSLRSSTSPNHDLPVSLGRFYQRVADLAKVFPWEKVAGYVIAVCTLHLGKATAAEWAHFDTELHATHFQGVQAQLPPSSSGNKRSAQRHDDPRHKQVCMSWNQGKCSGTDQRPCI
ncbi:hypothetical protein NDA13_002118 [Ustilago tritici]|nr:hypothetical protein NDA13_002118 [Ustilago tritici]